MERYAQYKDSGITWLPQVPAHWEIAHLRKYLSLVSIKGMGDKQLLSVTREKGVIERNVDDLEENHNFVPDDLSGYKYVQPGQFVINKMKSWQGSYGVSDYEGIVSPAYYVCDLDFPFKPKTIIAVTGTNGKTTTNNLLNHVIGTRSDEILSNLKGANMIQGIATTYVSNTRDHYDYGIFEVDEGTLRGVTRFVKPDYIIVSNFFRDQLDRFGEIDNLVEDVYTTIEKLPESTLVLNVDDPLVNKFSRLPNRIITFGLNLDLDEVQNSSLSMKNCPLCEGKLQYKSHVYGHFGDYECDKCDFKRPQPDFIISNLEERASSQVISIEYGDNELAFEYPYTGIYNAYNVLGVFSLLKQLGFADEEIANAMAGFSFHLGRMEEMEYKGRIIKVILTKNPIGLTQVINMISNDERSKTVVHILNDNPADGEDISWIWDAYTICDREETVLHYYCSGIRAEDIALKKKYDDVPLEKIIINDNFKQIIDEAIEDDVEIVYVLPTYTAVFETRDYIEKIVKNN